MEELKAISEFGMSGLLVIAGILMLRWFSSERARDMAQIAILSKSVDRNSESVANLARCVVALVQEMGGRPCLAEPLAGRAEALIAELDAIRVKIAEGIKQ